jgi:hypothetical protein
LPLCVGFDLQPRFRSPPKEKCDLLEQCVKNEKDFMIISTMTHKPILTHGYKEYWIIDGNCVYTFKPKG